MKIEVKPVLEDYFKFVKVAVFREKQVRRSIVIQSAMLPLVAMLLTLLARPINWFNVGFAAVLSVLWIIFYPKLFKRSLSKRLENNLRARAEKNENFLMPYTIEKIDGGLKATRNGQEFIALFDNLEMYEADDEHLLLIGGGFDFIIPRRMFNSDEEFNNLKDAIDFAVQVAIKRQ